MKGGSLLGGNAGSVLSENQHLSNKQILRVLNKIKKYRWVFITEHYPSGNDVVPNKDMAHGAGIRLYRHSGVYLSQPPFNVPASALERVLEVPALEGHAGGDTGVIRTFLYKPEAMWS